MTEEQKTFLNNLMSVKKLAVDIDVSRTAVDLWTKNPSLCEQYGIELCLIDDIKFIYINDKEKWNKEKTRRNQEKEKRRTLVNPKD